jgi:NADPH:quinone reductase-like Zn-dependent oxidoreductase
VRAVVITRHGDPSVLEVQQRPDPEPGPGEVRVDVQGSGLNFADLMARMGLYQDAPKPPCVVGYEVAGVVGAVGEGVTDRAPGDRVLGGTRFGGHAEQVVVGASNTVPIPDGMSFAEATAVPVNYSTAWAALRQYANVQPGERVLVHAAAGGVGIAAVQLAKHYGAHVTGTASRSKHDAVRELGADEMRSYDDIGGPYDVVLDAIGGASAKRSYQALRVGGRLVAYGASSVVSGEKRNLVKAAPQAIRMLRGFDLMEQMSNSKAVIGLNMLRLWDDRGTLDPWIQPLRELLDEGVIRPVVAAEIPFDRAADAHRLMQERRNVGKVVLVP